MIIDNLLICSEENAKNIKKIQKFDLEIFLKREGLKLPGFAPGKKAEHQEIIAEDLGNIQAGGQDLNCPESELPIYVSGISIGAEVPY